MNHEIIPIFIYNFIDHLRHLWLAGEHRKLCFWFLTNQKFAIIIIIFTKLANDAFITNTLTCLLVINTSPNGLSSYSVRCLMMGQVMLL